MSMQAKTSAALPGKLSIVLPAYNEAPHIQKNLLAVAEVAQKLSPQYEIIVVNDGSTDKTVEEVQRAARQNNRIQLVDLAANEGKGHALKAGTREASGDYIAFLDADLELRPELLFHLYDIMAQQGADVVIGSKMHPDSRVDYPRQRRAISRIYSLLLFLMFRLKVRDTQTGIKLFRAPVVRPVMQKILVKRFAYDIEVLALCRRSGAKIAECPIELTFRRENP